MPAIVVMVINLVATLDLGLEKKGRHSHGPHTPQSSSKTPFRGACHPSKEAEGANVTFPTLLLMSQEAQIENFRIFPTRTSLFSFIFWFWFWEPHPAVLKDLFWSYEGPYGGDARVMKMSKATESLMSKDFLQLYSNLLISKTFHPFLSQPSLKG